MILYTDVPLETVLDGIEKTPAYAELTIDGILMQVEPVSAYEAKIVRLLSPIPEHYLNPAYAPGQSIRFGPLKPGN